MLKFCIPEAVIISAVWYKNLLISSTISNLTVLIHNIPIKINLMPFSRKLAHVFLPFINICTHICRHFEGQHDRYGAVTTLQHSFIFSRCPLCIRESWLGGSHNFILSFPIISICFSYGFCLHKPAAQKTTIELTFLKQNIFVLSISRQLEQTHFSIKSIFLFWTWWT